MATGTGTTGTGATGTTTEKADRDPYDVPNQRSSENFNVYWGNNGRVSADSVDRLIDAFELAWEIELNEMGHPAPAGTDTHRFNVYIADTGNGAPAGYGAGGYYSTDREGWPMIAIALGSLGTPDYADIAAVHEFYHAVQGSLNTYVYAGASAWYWEATATWASAQVMPDNFYHASFLFSYIYLPQLPVNFFDYPDTGVLEEYYQYGAYLWPLYLSERTDYTLIRDSWLDDSGTGDPIEALRIGLADRDLDLDDVWLDHLAANIVWNYPSGDELESWAFQYAAYYPESANVTADIVSASGTDGLIDGPADLAPMRYGSNAIAINGPVGGPMTVRIEGDPEGDEGSPARFGARLVFGDEADAEVVEIPFDDTTGTIETDRDADTIWILVGAWTDDLGSSWTDETFSYRFSVDVDKPPVDTGLWVSSDDDDDDESGGCGCATGSPAAPIWVLLFALAGRRRMS